MKLILFTNEDIETQNFRLSITISSIAYPCFISLQKSILHSNLIN